MVSNCLNPLWSSVHDIRGNTKSSWPSLPSFSLEWYYGKSKSFAKKNIIKVFTIVSYFSSSITIQNPIHVVSSVQWTLFSYFNLCMFFKVTLVYLPYLTDVSSLSRTWLFGPRKPLLKSTWKNTREDNPNKIRIYLSISSEVERVKFLSAKPF